MCRKCSLSCAVAMIVVAIAGNAGGALVCSYSFNNPDNIGQADVGPNLFSMGGVYSVNGQVGGALTLGGNGYLCLPTYFSDPTIVPDGLPVGDSSYTIASFINTSAGSGARNLQPVVYWGTHKYFDFGKENDFLTRTGEWPGADGIASWNNGYTETHNDYDLVSPQLTVANGLWHHMAVTYDSGTRVKDLYLDGVCVATKVCDAGLNVQSANFVVGTEGVEGRSLNGSLDNLQIYSNALSAAEIKALALADAPTKYWSSAANTAWDRDNHQNWATASGGPYNAITWSNGDKAVFEGTAGNVAIGSGRRRRQVAHVQQRRIRHRRLRAR